MENKPENNYRKTEEEKRTASLRRLIINDIANAVAALEIAKQRLVAWGIVGWTRRA